MMAQYEELSSSLAILLDVDGESEEDDGEILEFLPE